MDPSATSFVGMACSVVAIMIQRIYVWVLSSLSEVSVTIYILLVYRLFTDVSALAAHSNECFGYLLL